MSQTTLLVKNWDDSNKSICEDIEAALLLKWDGSKGEEEKGTVGIIGMGMMVVCLSFVSIFTVPMALRNLLGMAGAREAMESVEFEIYVAMDSLGFFSSIVAVLVMIQSMDMKNVMSVHMKRLRMICSMLAHFAMGCVAIAFIFAAAALAGRL